MAIDAQTDLVSFKTLKKHDDYSHPFEYGFQYMRRADQEIGWHVNEEVMA